ncbi:GPP34 family phosphoprotein [Actinoplanes derwentensis]|uniref:Golgi phosphoprotein 3 (GPP34) n=1 Tax=Actinoplanes derwentensis TaxID=113562 RepID=A0A1H1XTT4_9ACTN|nr:GPP34 family phosphoprotein [Actinoplanes derwentensis]GID89196.1 hypothetical protein Ade03nite_81200 [Actinoplanes derwentensis]SDT12289.1 Golgi phosphoprotein 3 (GPP34) [Actinoplanes derwentensis]
MTTYATTTGKADPMNPSGPRSVLPLHAELYLLAHNDDTGALLINQQSLELGLAGALLLELAFAEHVAVGYDYDEFRRQWQPRPGRLTVCQSQATGNTLWDAAVATIGQTRRRDEQQLRAWLRSFASADLYERTRAALVTAGLLQRTRRRRLAGLITADVYLPVHYGFAVRARARIRDAVAHHAQSSRYRPTPPSDESSALCGLITVLELAEFLYDAMPVDELNTWLALVAERQNHTAITAVVQAVDAGRGDLAVAAIR